MIPLIEREIIERRKWIAKEDFLEMMVVAQSAPGPIALNTAVFVGYKMRGYAGALAATLGVVVPSFTVILLLAIFFSNVRNNPIVDAAFKGMRPAVVALIVAPMINILRGMGWWVALIALAVGVAVWYCGISPIILLVAGALVGIAFAYWSSRTINSDKR